MRPQVHRCAPPRRGFFFRCFANDGQCASNRESCAAALFSEATSLLFEVHSFAHLGRSSRCARQIGGLRDLLIVMASCTRSQIYWRFLPQIGRRPNPCWPLLAQVAAAVTVGFGFPGQGFGLPRGSLRTKLRRSDLANASSPFENPTASQVRALVRHRLIWRDLRNSSIGNIIAIYSRSHVSLLKRQLLMGRSFLTPARISYRYFRAKRALKTWRWDPSRRGR